MCELKFKLKFSPESLEKKSEKLSEVVKIVTFLFVMCENKIKSHANAQIIESTEC
jgi:hypothetical protein